MYQVNAKVLNSEEIARRNARLHRRASLRAAANTGVGAVESSAEDLERFGRNVGKIGAVEVSEMNLILERDVEAIWTSSSIRIARAFVLLTWLAIWAAVSLTLAAFVSLQYRRADKKKSSPRQRRAQSAPLNENVRAPAEKDKDTVPDGNL